MTKRKAVKHLGLSEELNEYLAIGAYLISERAKGESSFYFPYLSVLPEDKDLNPMFRWSKEELEALKGSPSLAACLSLKMKVKAEFEMMDRDVFSLRRDVFPEDLFTLEAWEWAFAVLFSRAILFDPQSVSTPEFTLEYFRQYGRVRQSNITVIFPLILSSMRTKSWHWCRTPTF